MGLLNLDRKTEIVSIILSDLEDKTFINNLHKAFNHVAKSTELDEDEDKIRSFIAYIIKERCEDKRDAYSYLNSLKFNDRFMMKLTTRKRGITKDYKNTIVEDILNEEVALKVDSILKRMQEIKDDIAKSGRTSYKARRELKELSELLQKVSEESNVTDEDDEDLIIFDPIDKSTHGTSKSILDSIKHSYNNSMSTIPALDRMFGGYVFPETLTVFGALPANFKSGTLQNLAIYISKTNTTNKFKLDEGMKPNILFVSCELNKRQITERSLAFAGMSIDAEQLDRMTDEDLDKIIIASMDKEGCHIPISYYIKIGETITANDVANYITRLRRKGFQTIALIVDYVDLLGVADKDYKPSTSSAEAAKALQQKAKELRVLAKEYQLAAFTGAQLNGEANSVMGKVQGYQKIIDPLHHYHGGMLAGSKALEREVDQLIFSYKTEVEERSPDSDVIEVKKFISYIMFKDRDNKALGYKKSVRDITNEATYNSQRSKLKMNLALAPLLTTTSRYHVVIPLEGFKLSETDYAKSIMMFYPNDRAGFIDLRDITESNKVAEVISSEGDVEDEFLSLVK